MQKLNDAPLALTFDDVTLSPVRSTIKSRKEPDVSTVIAGMKLKIPIIASPMNTVCEEEMIWRMDDLGGVGVLHRYMSAEDQLKKAPWRKYGEQPINFYVAIGSSGDYLERAKMLYNAGAKHFCVDVANGHSKSLLDAVEALRKQFSDIVVMAGSVCSYVGVWDLIQSGASAVRVGIGNGSRCITRLVTGHGLPQMTALEDCCKLKLEYPNVSIIADGGIRNSGDIVKCLAIGADAVMLGNLLAGTEETPGAVNKDPTTGELYKMYAGMASEAGRKFNGWFSEDDASFVPEGVSGRVPFKGSAVKVIDDLVGGLKVGMSFSNARTLEELRQNAKWSRVTGAGYQEGLPRL